MPNKELLMIPGPTPVADEVYVALAQETLSHTDLRFAKTFRDALDMTKEMFKTDGEVYVIAGSGTLAMEIALINTVPCGEKVLIVSHGFFGDRYTAIATALGFQAETLQAPWGFPVPSAEIEARLQRGDIKAMTVTHVDTSTGVQADLETLVPLAKKYGVLFILDGVCASAAVDEDMNKEYGPSGGKIDVVLTASQKAIGAPPGLAIAAFSQAALQARAALPSVPGYYIDIENWTPIMREPQIYFATHPVNMIYAYQKSMEIVMREGLDTRYKRHTAYGKAVRSACREYGLQPLAEEAWAAATMSCFMYPTDNAKKPLVDDAAFRNDCAEQGLILAGMLGTLAGKGFRIGHMGNSTPEMLSQALAIIGTSLAKQGLTINADTAVRCFADTYKANI